MKVARTIDVGVLRAEVFYDPDTGFFKWKTGARGRRPGTKPLGSPVNGYLVIGINYRKFYAHRMAWAYMHGVWPDAEIDHINGDKADNRIANLRQATRSFNAQNKRRASIRSTSGLLGAHPHSYCNKWYAMIQINRRRQYLGTFNTPEEAHAAYVAAKRQLHKGCTL